ncbi:unnamed protein product [Prorocentrum cordatum]|uniref:Uncharacterized protein n=1 Tax=Prorocentrum cordatum TaxID=2364126 RepID=A0ABN9PHH8_9DINO|nr:unnamed protein product [Polarella glacialis]
MTSSSQSQGLESEPGASSAVVATATDTLAPAFDLSITNVDKRFPNVRTHMNATIPWYNSQGERNFARHMGVNDREQKENLSTQIKTILSFGLANDARGVPTCQLSEGDVPPYRLFSRAHLATAFYMCCDNPKWRANENAQAALAKGLTRVQVYQCRAPDDALVWMKDFLNFDFNQKAGINFVETIEWGRKINAELAAYEHLNPGWATGSDESRRQKVWQWIKDNYKDQAKQGIIPSNNLYELVRYIAERFNEIDAADPGKDSWAIFRKHMLDCCVFGDGRIKNYTVLECLKAVLSTFCGMLNNKPVTVNATPKLIRMMMEECVKFLVPTVSDNIEDSVEDNGISVVLDKNASRVSWHLIKLSKTSAALKSMFVDISSGKFYKATQKSIDKLRELKLASDKTDDKSKTDEKPESKPDEKSKRRRILRKTPSQEEAEKRRREADRNKDLQKIAVGAAPGAAAEGEEGQQNKGQQSEGKQNDVKQEGKDDGNDKASDKDKDKGKTRRAGKAAAAGGAVEIKHMEAVRRLCLCKENGETIIPWIEDAILAHNACVAEALGSKGITAAMRAASDTAVDEVVFGGTSKDSKKTLAGWNAVRGDVKKMVVDRIRKRCLQLDGEDDDAMGGDEYDDTPQTAMEASIAKAFGNMTLVAALREFISSNPYDTPVTFLPVYMDVSQRAWKFFEAEMKDDLYRKSDAAVKVVLSSIVGWVFQAIAAAELVSLEDETMGPIQKIGFVWADPEAYPNFKVPEVVDDIFESVNAVQGFMCLRSKIVAEVACSLLARTKTKVTWATEEGVVLKIEAVDGVMSALRYEPQRDLSMSEVQVLDLRTVGHGRKVWESAWVRMLSSIAPLAIDDHAKATLRPQQLDLSVVCATAQTVLGIQEASKAAQDEFEKQIAELESAAPGGEAVVTAAASLVPELRPAEEQRDPTLHLGTLAEVMSHQRTADTGGPKGAELRTTLGIDHASLTTQCIIKLPEHEITAAFVKQLSVHLESEFLNLVFQPEDDLFESVTVDVTPPAGSGAGSKPAVKLLSNKKLTESFKMYFAGHVGPARGKTAAFHITTIAGITPNGKDESHIQVPLFLNFDPVEHSITGSCPIPAWMVERLETNVDANKTGRGKKRTAQQTPPGPDDAKPPEELPTLAVGMEVVQFELPELLAVSAADGEEAVSTIDARCPVLEPTAHGLGQGTEQAPVKLSRRWAANEKVVNNKGEKGNGKGTSKGKGRSDKSDMIDLGLGMGAKYEDACSAANGPANGDGGDAGRAAEGAAAATLAALRSKVLEGTPKSAYAHLLE